MLLLMESEFICRISVSLTPNAMIIEASVQAVHSYLFSLWVSFWPLHLYLQIMSARGQYLQIVYGAATKTGWIKWFHLFAYNLIRP